GPAAGVDTPQGAADSVSRWIAQSAEWIEKKYQPALSLIYLPHLDYNLQRCGPFTKPTPDPSQEGNEGARGSQLLSQGAGVGLNPAITRDLQQIDSIVGDLISFFQRR